MIYNVKQLNRMFINTNFNRILMTYNIYPTRSLHAIHIITLKQLMELLLQL